jgi:hypothetical protein
MVASVRRATLARNVINNNFIGFANLGNHPSISRA